MWVFCVFIVIHAFSKFLYVYLVLQVKREELLQFAQRAITGLKINSDLARSVRNRGFQCHFLYTISARHLSFMVLSGVSGQIVLCQMFTKLILILSPTVISN